MITTLKELIGLAFVTNDINDSLNTWCDLFLSAVNEHIPKCIKSCVANQTCIDTEWLLLIRKKPRRKRRPL
jgi:hypothetical protein